MKALEALFVVALFLFIGALFAFVITMMVRTGKRDGRTDQEEAGLIRLAHGRGWSYTPSVPGWADRYCGAEPFPQTGTSLAVSDYIAGEFRGRPFCCFEYRSRPAGVGETGAKPQMRFVSVFAVSMPAAVPRLIIRRPRALDGVFAGGRVVQLGIPAFDEDFHVISDDESFARNVVAGYLTQFLTSDPRAKASPLRFHGSELITWHQGRLRPQEIEPNLNYLRDVLDRMPAHT